MIPECVIRQWGFRLLHTRICTPEGAGNPAGVWPECSDWGADQNDMVDTPLSVNCGDTGWNNINSAALRTLCSPKLEEARSKKTRLL